MQKTIYDNRADLNYLLGLTDSVKGRRFALKMKVINPKGMKTVIGMCYGSFLVHLSLQGDGYAVSHIPTQGRRVHRKPFPTQAEARCFAVLLEKFGGWASAQDEKLRKNKEFTVNLDRLWRKRDFSGLRVYLRSAGLLEEEGFFGVGGDR